MKRLIFNLFWFVVVLTLFSSCIENIIPDYHTKDIKLDVNVEQYSSGFIEVKVNASDFAYYYISCEPVDSPDELEILKEWGGEDMIVDIEVSIEDGMGILGEQINRDKQEYKHWSDSLKNEGINHIADFHSFKIDYYAGDHYFYYLKPNTLYWVYAFVMDIKTNEPVGKLYLKTIRTRSQSLYSNVRFNYRVDGYWDYCYPINMENGSIIDNVPWVGETVCLDDVDQSVFPNPGAYFDNRFLQQDLSSRILRGIYAHCNNGIGDNTTSTLFEKGKTYYTAFCIFDGERSKTAFDIYKFVWNGVDTQLFMTDEESEYRFW